MTDLLEFLLSLLALYLAIRILYLIVKRCRAVGKLRSLKKTSGAEVMLSPALSLSYLRISDAPDARVCIGRRIYLIRFLSGRSALSSVHFASDRFVTVYSKFRFSISNLLTRKRAGAMGYSQDTSRQRVYIIPELKIPCDIKNDNGREVIEVIMLDPEPSEVTFVTEGKTSIKAAYTGDLVYGRMIFTPEAFAIYADRVQRQEHHEKERELV